MKVTVTRLNMHLIILEPQSPSFDISELHKIRQLTDLEALELCQVFGRVSRKKSLSFFQFQDSFPFAAA